MSRVKSNYKTIQCERCPANFYGEGFRSFSDIRSYIARYHCWYYDLEDDADYCRDCMKRALKTLKQATPGPAGS